MTGEKIRVVDYFTILVKWRKQIIINGFIICLITAIFSLIMPRSYKASTTILPPAEEGGLGLSSLLNNLPIGGLGLGGMVSDETNVYLAILNSRTVAENIINKFDLIKRYKSENMEEAIRTLRAMMAIELNDDGTLSIAVKAKTPYFAGKKEEDEARNLAKDMANYFVSELDKLNRKLKTQRAQNTRIFIEKRYKQNLADLAKAEEAFKDFQKKHGTIELTEQTKASITAAAELKAQIIAKEIELGVLKKYVSNTHSEYIRKQTELNELKQHYNEFQSGAKQTGGAMDVFIPLKNLPDLGIEYVRLYRELQIQEKILEFIMPQYEQAKINEKKDTPTVQVLDPAVAPIKRSSPKRMFMVLGAGIFVLFLFIIAAYIKVNAEYLGEEHPEQYRQWSYVLHNLKPTQWFKKE
ncbi:hypothetical protein B6D60_07390 [candidate division KSB1 bacterium 4484_87]|nr:MAG: hypothetical protein B6D60_07390 [candidate division KSB1 bacterium 4484_87]